MKNRLVNAIKKIIEENLIDRPILVWYDTEGTLKNVITQSVPKDVETILFQCSYLAIRAKVEREDPEFKRKWFIYIPEEPQDPSWVLDYELFGKRIELNLERVLVEKLGLISDAKIRELLRGERGRQLAAHWEEVMHPITGRITKKELINGLLSISFSLGLRFNTGRAILEYVTFPEQYSASLDNLDLHEFFAEKIQLELGMNNLTDSTPVPAKTLAAAVLFSELFVKSGGIGEGEFEKLLPHEEKRLIWARLATDWQENERLKNGFIHWSIQLGQEYDVRSKLAGLESLIQVTSFPVVDDVLLQELCLRISSDPKGLSEHLETIKKVANARKEIIWSKIGFNKVWNIIDAATELISECNSSTNFLEKLPTTTGVDDLITEYITDNGWWRIDELYHIVAAEEDIDENSRKLFVEPAAKTYFNWLAKLAAKFGESTSKMRSWSSTKAIAQSSFWEKLVRGDDEPLAVLFIDALRYDLCRRLSQKLSEEGHQTKIKIMLSSLPSITEVGMTALLPHEKDLGITIKKGKMLVYLNNKPIKNRSDRQNWLKSFLGDSVTFLKLDEILNLPKHTLNLKIQGFRYIIVMDRDIDKAGTFLPEITIKLFDQLVDRLAKAVSSLHKAGIQKVTIGTDHGFLLIPKGYQLDLVKKVKVLSDVVKSRRYLIGNPPKIEALLQFPLEFIKISGDGIAMFTRGLSIIGEELESLTFTHGGISLQENCIAALSSTLKISKEEGKVIIQAEIPDAITTAIFLVKISPLPKPKRDLPRSVHVEVYSEDEKIAQSDSITIQKESQKARLIIRKIPQKVEVRVVDSDSEEVLIKRIAEVKLAGYDDSI